MNEIQLLAMFSKVQCQLIHVLLLLSSRNELIVNMFSLFFIEERVKATCSLCWADKVQQKPANCWFSANQEKAKYLTFFPGGGGGIPDF